MDNNHPTDPGFWRICDENGVCHCDWRLTLTQCEEHSAFYYMHVADIIIAGLAALGAGSISFYRVKCLNQPVFDLSSGFPRPRPIESMITLGAVFNAMHLVYSVILITDSVPNIAFRYFFFEFKWQFGFAALACYLFGIAQTFAETNRVIYMAWVRSPVVVDVLCTALVTLPFLTNNICSIGGGVAALRGNNELAAKFTRALCYLWAFYTGFLSLLIMFSGSRLIHLLASYLERRTYLGPAELTKIKLGLVKLKIIVITASVCLAMFSVVYAIYATCRESVMLNMKDNIVIASLWMYDGEVASLCIEFSVMLNPRMTIFGAFGASSGNSSSGRSTGASGAASPAPHNQTSIPPPKFYNTGRQDGAHHSAGYTSEHGPDKFDYDMPPYPRAFPTATFSGSDPGRSQIDDDKLQYVLKADVRPPPHFKSSAISDQQTSRASSVAHLISND